MTFLMYSRMKMPQYKIKTLHVAKNKHHFVYVEYKF